MLVYELELLVQTGLSAREALNAATTAAARACGLSEQVGTLNAISTLRDIDTVVIPGELVKRGETPCIRSNSISEVRF